MAGKTKVGIVALQGAVGPHVHHLERMGVEAVEVRKPNHLLGLSGLILPGGESSAMIHLLKLNKLWEPLQDFVVCKPVLGVCAGAILLAKKVHHPEQESLQAIDIDLARNAFGRQNESFTAAIQPTAAWEGGEIEGVFIRAPRITRVGPDVTVLFQFQGEPVMVSQGKKLAACFHPELTDSLAIHQYFVSQCESEDGPWMTDSQNTSASLSLN